MSARVTITPGMKFGRLTVVSEASPASNGRTRCNCKCECGQLKVVRAASLKSGGVRSCGCWQREKLHATRIAFRDKWSATKGFKLYPRVTEAD